MSNKLKKFPKPDTKIKKRLMTYSVFTFILLVLLTTRIVWLQFVQAAELKEDAYKQQIATRTILPKRGNIYDSSGKGLALSAEVDTVSVNPTRLKTSSGSDVDKPALAKAFSTILGLDETDTLEKLNSDSTTVKIAEKVSTDKIASLQDWLSTNKITAGINIDSSTRTLLPL